MDGDRGINDPVIYSISSENGVSQAGAGQGEGEGSVRPLEGALYCTSLDSTRPGWFDIGKQDGVITVNSPLDREQLLEEDEEVQVQVTVSEGATAPFAPPLCTPLSAPPLSAPTLIL